jgi:hypothetical protein
MLNVKIHVDGPKNPTSGMCSGFRRPLPYQFMAEKPYLTNSKFLAKKGFYSIIIKGIINFVPLVH